MAPKTFASTRLTMIDVAGGKIAHRQVGTGPDLVLIHGWPLHSATWRHLVPLLAPHATLHFFDVPGAGESTWTNGAPTLRSSVPALAEALRATGLRSYVLMGHDSGGALARRLAADNPKARGLVLVDTEIPRHHSPLLLGLIAACNLPLATVLFPRALQRRAFRRSIFGFGSSFTDPRHVDGDFADLFLTPLADPHVAKNQMQIGQSFDLAFIDELDQIHPKIRAKTLCIWGENDPYFPVDAARAMVPSLPPGTLFETIPGARLMPHEDHPNEVAALVRSFLERLARDEEPTAVVHAAMA